jgi:cyanophycin synthetase
MPDMNPPNSPLLAGNREPGVSDRVPSDLVEIRLVQKLRGPSVWALFPLIEVTLRVNADEAARQMARLGRCEAWQSILDAGASEPSNAGNAGTQLAQACAAVTLHLQTAAWKSVEFARVERLAEDDVYRMLVQCHDEELAVQSLREAIELCKKSEKDIPHHLQAARDRLRDFATGNCLQESAWAIVEAARARNIPCQRLGNRGLLQLGYGVHQRRASGVHTDNTSILARNLAADQEVAFELLRSIGVPCVKTSGGLAATSANKDELFHVLVVGDQVIAVARENAPPEMADILSQMHPDVVAQCVEAAAMLEMDIATLKIQAGDLRLPLGEQSGCVASVQPGMTQEGPLACQPVFAKYGEAVVERLFPEGKQGRVPIVAVTGVNGKTTTTRLIAWIVESLGLRVGLTCTDGVFVGGRGIDTGDCSGPKSASKVLCNPETEVAVLETARGGILREGLGFDRCDVAVVTNVADGDHLGISWVKTPEDLASVKRVIVDAVAPTGCAVLNADDPLVAQMSERCPGRVVYFCRQHDHLRISEHRSAEGRAVFSREGTIVIAEGSQETSVMSAAEIPLTRGGRIDFQVENVLAAVAAAWSLNVPLENIRARLIAFDSDMQTCPARFNVLEHNGATIILDYGHNPSAVAALVQSMERFPASKRYVVYSADGDRTDEQIRQQSAHLREAFDHVILYEEVSRFRGRKPGELYRLLRQGLAGGSRDLQIEQVDGELAAIGYALDLLQPGELVLIQVDAVAKDLDFVRDYIAKASGNPSA